MPRVLSHFNLHGVHCFSHVVFVTLKITLLDGEVPLNIAFKVHDSQLVRTSHVVNEVALSELQHLPEQHVLNQSALSSRAHAKDKHWLLSR